MKSFRTLFEELKEEVKGQADYFIMKTIVFESFALIESLLEESDSLWLMIEEQRKSEIEQHATSLRAELDRKINEVLLLSKTKVVDA